MKSLARINSSVSTFSFTVALLAGLLAAGRVPAATTIYVGINGVSATTNWSDSANFIDSGTLQPEAPDNNAANFNYNTAVQTPGVITVNADGDYGTPGSGSPQAWALIFGQTNGYQTVMVQPGIQLEMQSANGAPGNGFNVGPQAQGSGGGNGGGSTVNIGPYTNYTTIEGPGSFLVNGQLRVEGRASTVVNHYTILDMSALNTFTQTNTTGGSSRFLLMNNNARSQGLIYLATNNFINIYSDVQIGYGSSSSNSLPIGLYLGMSNSITTGPNDNGNQLVVGIDGTTNAFMKFNPKFLGGATKPTAYLSGNGSGVSGMMNWVAIGQSLSSFVPANAVVDLTGGIVTWNINTLRLGRAGQGTTGQNGYQAIGTLSFDSGTITVVSGNIGSQETSGGAPGIGVLNIGSNATFTASSTLYVPWVAGTPNASSSGTINVNGGTFNAASVIDTNHLGTLNVSNSTLGLALTSASATATNIFIGTLGVNGTTNVINITSITPFLGGNASIANPIRFHVIHYATLNGTLNFGLGSLPATYNNAYPYGGYLDTATTPNTIDFVLTNAPPGARTLTWSGTNGVGAADGNWNTSDANWLTNGTATIYNQFDLANFNDVAAPAQTNINLTTTLTPYSLTVNNTSSIYTFGGSGNISGTDGLSKQGAGTLIFDETGPSYNNFTGGITVNGGTLQVGNADGNGTLSTGSVSNNATLVFNHGANSIVANSISGSGTVIQSGGDTLNLSGNNAFTGNVLVTNSSILQLGSSSALGTTNGGTIIANGSTLDLSGRAAVGESVTIQGSGTSGQGAINNSGADILPALTSITLSGDAALGAVGRWDLRANPTATLSTGGHAYNLTKVGSGFLGFVNATIDTNLGNIDVQSGTLDVESSTTGLGNPTNTLTIESGATLFFYNASNPLNKIVQVNDNGNVHVNSGNVTISGPVVLTNDDNSASSYSSFDVDSGTSLSLNGPVTGNSILYLNTGTGTLTVSSNSPSFSGGSLVALGTLVVNANFGTGTNTIYSGATLAGNGSAGLVDMSGNFYPGNQGVAGTFGASGGLILEGGANLTMDLNTTTTVGGGANDLVAVTGDLTVNDNIITINPLSNLANGSTYTLFTYTGNLTGSFAGAQNIQASQYTFLITNVTSTTPKKIQLVVTGGAPSPLRWNNASGNGEWDVASSQNWSNLVTHVAADYFYSFDSVVFDDSITNSATPATSIDIGAGQVVIPSVMTNNSTTNYTISGAGKISGAASVVKLGSSTLTISTINDFTGNFAILGGIVQIKGQLQPGGSGLGVTNGTLTVTNGTELIVNEQGGYPQGDAGFGGKPLVISGNGADGNGAIQNNGNAMYHDASPAGGLGQNIKLAGNTTIGGSSRWDWGDGTVTTTLSSGGSNYNFTAIEPGYSEWHEVTIDTNLGNIDFSNSVAGQQTWRVSGMGGSLGNPTNVLTVHPNVLMSIQHGDTGAGDNGYVKVIHIMNNSVFQYQPSGGTGDYRIGPTLILDAGAGVSFFSGNGGSGSGTVISGPVILNGLVHLQVGDSTVTFSNVISGLGGFFWDNFNNTVAFAATNTYQGITDIRSGRTLALIGNGSISQSTPISLASGAILIATNRVDQALTLSAGQTLQGGGTVVAANVNVNSGATVQPGSSNSTDTLTVSSNLVFQAGSTSLMLLNKGSSPSNSVLTATGTITYGGTLSVTNIGSALAAGNSFKLFNAASYNGAFTTISPATPGAGLAWNTGSLTSSGVLNVLATGKPTPVITGISLSGTTLTLTGTNGADNGTYVLLTTTNLALPLAQWTPVLTNTFDGSGNLNLSTNIISPGSVQQFYILSQ